MEEKKEQDTIGTVVEWGTEMSGGAAAAALGFLAGGPAGAAVVGAGGVLITRVLKAIGNEVSERVLSPREKVRIGAAFAEAAAQNDRRINAGDAPRTDEYLDDGTERPPAQEVGEGLLLAAQRSYQEKKVPYIGRLAANLNFAPTFDVSAARWITHLADRLSYTQFCLLKLALIRTASEVQLPGKIENKRTKGPAHLAVISEILEMHQLGLINFGPAAVLSILDVDPNKMQLQGFGVHLHDMMGLQSIPLTDIEEVKQKLAGQSLSPK